MDCFELPAGGAYYWMRYLQNGPISHFHATGCPYGNKPGAAVGAEYRTLAYIQGESIYWLCCGQHFSNWLIADRHRHQDVPAPAHHVLDFLTTCRKEKL